ncbi:RNA pyrophosphohydrolase [Caulobacter sp. UNC279MFTsu5.1]|uniref:RNA pyrophosphohydrolase n=1 Tax=Caulobacter sp. UNC279MFTsu5.1 TaxID=1502775 RepID=UPI0008E90F82|nr:RNA pyrophosphohydrolase [Caulobacter sp. UNC279MFTsu5.1]SFJ43277.1 putative (di)nucleoside polyphosphate hydrolase [Caulobacter sp. UNC279MFTsu5.1]
MSASDLDLDLHPEHRPNVGVVLFHPDGRVWLGRRCNQAPPHNWQFPQGGVDDGEDLLAAARRELAEETGVTSVDYLGRTESWLIYDFPAEFAGSKKARGFKGQKQVWFAFRFLGDESEIDLEADAHVEFDAWKWGALDETPELIVPFKRAVYEQVVAAFGGFARGG